MCSYVQELIEEEFVTKLKYPRVIYTDCIEKSIEFIWEGFCNKETVFLSEEEVQELLQNDLLNLEEFRKNEKTIDLLEPKVFNYGIVCEMLPPSMEKLLRKELVDDLRKKGYIGTTMKPVYMQNGVKTLIQNKEADTYQIKFRVHDKLNLKINHDLLEQFTKVIFQDLKFEINYNEIKFLSLSEKEAFSKKSIELFRKYDDQLCYLNSSIDKVLLLRAVMQAAYLDEGSTLLNEEHFAELGSISFPQDKQKRFPLKENGRKDLLCGVLRVKKEYKHRKYTYKFFSACDDQIRELMKLNEKLLKVEYKESIKIEISSVSKYFEITCYDDAFFALIERDFICFDMAVKFLRNKDKIERRKTLDSIMSLLELDSSGRPRNEYDKYLVKLQEWNT